MHELERERELVDPEVVGSLLAAVAQLREAEEELDRQNAELASLASALENERRRYERLFDRAPLAHLTTDSNGRILEANAAAASMLQIDRRYLIGKPVTLFVSPPDRRRFRAWLLDPLRDARPRFRFQRRRHITFDGQVTVHRDDETLAWVIQDVTEELRAEQQLWELNRELERRVALQAGEIAAVYQQLPVGVAIVPADGSSVPRLNRRAREILGDVFAFDNEVAQALGGASIHSATVSVTDGDGYKRVLEVSAGPLRAGGGDVIGAVITFDDITDRERVERADREFVSNASHQLRTPITAIASAVAALKAGAGEDAAERGRFLDHLETEAERLARIIDAMLVLSRAQRGEVHAPLALVRLRPLLRRLTSEVRPAPGVRVSSECAASVAAIAHPALLEEAIASGLANAVEHTREGEITVTAEEWDDRVVIEIRDTGPGMAPHVRERAFDRFFSSTSRRRSAGLGLAIAAAAVQASRGTIELVSRPGEGTRLRLLLPSARLFSP